MGCQRYPPSSDTSKSSEHPYEAYTSCQLWSSPACISFTGAIITALATLVRKPQRYKMRNGGEVCESTRAGGPKVSNRDAHETLPIRAQNTSAARRLPPGVLA